MAAIKKITASMFDDLYSKYLDDDDPHLRKDDWRALLVPKSEQEEDGTGYVLVDSENVNGEKVNGEKDAEKIVGMLGMIRSRRTIGGSERRFCNLHSWFVDDDYRGYSLTLMRPALRLTDHTLTDFTPTDRVCAIAKRLGFEQLDSRLKILLPFSWGAGKRDVQLVDDTRLIASHLDEADARLMADHTRDRFYHLLVTDGDERCYLIFNRVDRHVLPYCHLHYISDKAVFARHQAAIRRHMLKMAGGRYVAVNARMVSEIKLRSSVTVSLCAKQLYRPANVAAEQGIFPEEVDSLYTEVSLLWLTTFADAGHFLRQCVGRIRDIIPGQKSEQGSATTTAACEATS